MSARRLENLKAVIVQVGSELGRGCALRLASEGADVLVVDPSQERADGVAAAIVAQGGTSMSIQAQVSNEQEIHRLADLCERKWGHVDVLVLIISALDWWSETELSMSAWEECLRINLLTPIFYSTAFRPLLAKSGRGSLIIYGSIDGQRGNPRVPAYSVARGGLIPFTHIMAELCGSEGTRVNYIAGAAIVPIGPEAKPPFGSTADSAALLEATPLRRMATPDDFAGVVSFLASSDSSYVTGSVIVVDGGRTSITPGTAIQN